MNHQDAELAEVTIVLCKAYENRIAEAVSMLKAANLEVTETDEEHAVVEGTCDVSVLPALKGLECVNYVRVGTTWIADYPPGDPRDKDGPEEGDLAYEDR